MGPALVVVTQGAGLEACRSYFYCGVEAGQ